MESDASEIVYVERRLLTDARSVAEELRDALRFCQQLTAKSCAALLTESHCRSELLLRCGVKLGLHLLSWE